MEGTSLLVLLAVLPATVTAVLGLGVALVLRRLRGQTAAVEQIHVLVNSRLTEALDEIRALRAEVVKLRGGAPPETPHHRTPASGTPPSRLDE